jgi:hypothetical protein
MPIIVTSFAGAATTIEPYFSVCVSFPRAKAQEDEGDPRDTASRTWRWDSPVARQQLDAHATNASCQKPSKKALSQAPAAPVRV